MRVIELSDHPGDMLTDVTLRRQAARKRAEARYEDTLIQHQARVQTIRVKRDLARRNHQWWTWLRLSFAIRAEKRRAPRPPAADATATDTDTDTDTEEKIRAAAAVIGGTGRVEPRRLPEHLHGLLARALPEQDPAESGVFVQSATPYRSASTGSVDTIATRRPEPTWQKTRPGDGSHR